MIDWPTLIREIEASGMTLYKIGLCVHLQRGQIIAILEGREPKYSDGELLLQLHKLTVHTSIPRTMSLAIA